VAGMAPEELCELAHLCGRRAKLIVRHGKASSLVAGDLVYLLGTGLLNSQLSEEDHFEQAPVDSHVAVVYATSKCGVTLVNPDRTEGNMGRETSTCLSMSSSLSHTSSSRGYGRCGGRTAKPTLLQRSPCPV
jgi:hypothetical protein